MMFIKVIPYFVQNMCATLKQENFKFNTLLVGEALS